MNLLASLLEFSKNKRKHTKTYRVFDRIRADKKMIQSSGQKFLPPWQKSNNWLNFAVCQSIALKNGFSQKLMKKKIIIKGNTATRAFLD